MDKINEKQEVLTRYGWDKLSAEALDMNMSDRIRISPQKADGFNISARLIKGANLSEEDALKVIRAVGSA